MKLYLRGPEILSEILTEKIYAINHQIVVSSLISKKKYSDNKTLLTNDVNFWIFGKFIKRAEYFKTQNFKKYFVFFQN